MNIYDLLQNNAGVNITINAGQLVEAIDYCVQKTKAEFEAKQVPEQYITRKTAAALLGCDISSLYRWNRDGYLCAVKVFGKVRYRLSEVEAVISGKA